MRVLLFLLLILGTPGVVLAQNQHELNVAAEAEFQKADAELNRVYQQLMAKLDKPSRERLIDAQLLWIKFRDADARARAEVNQGGSIYPMIVSGSRASATRARIAELKEWIDEFR